MTSFIEYVSILVGFLIALVVGNYVLAILGRVMA